MSNSDFLKFLGIFFKTLMKYSGGAKIIYDFLEFPKIW